MFRAIRAYSARTPARFLPQRANTDRLFDAYTKLNTPPNEPEARRARLIRIAQREIVFSEWLDAIKAEHDAIKATLTANNARVEALMDMVDKNKE